MIKITDYRIVQEATMDKLEVAVSEEMENGWQPYGPLHPETEFSNPSQVMVKYEDDDAAKAAN